MAEFSPSSVSQMNYGATKTLRSRASTSAQGDALTLLTMLKTLLGNSNHQWSNGVTATTNNSIITDTQAPTVLTTSTSQLTTGYNHR